MQTQDFNNDDIKEISIDFNLNSEIDVEDFDFKPVNQGLGFHQDRKQNSVSLNSIPSLKDLRKENVEPRVHTRRRTINRSNTFDKSLLSDVYSSKHQMAPKESKKEISFKFKMPTVYSQLGAFFIDLGVICTITLLTVGLFVFAAGLDYEIILNAFTKIQLVSYISPLFIVFFVSYFTLMDLGQSLGKSFFNIQILDITGSSPSLKQSFIRSLVTLSSSIALFFPLIMDFQDRLSETKLHQK